MFRHYQGETGPAFAAISRAVDQAVAQPPGLERMFSNPGSVGVDWRRASRCHHSNELVVAAIGGMIDSSAARVALGSASRLVDVADRTPSLDEIQQRIFLAAAGDDRAPRNPLAFADALDELIVSEGLEGYFERGGEAAINGYDFCPYGYVEAIAAEDGPGELERTKANANRLPPGQRIPLIVICALYDGLGARDVFKGDGWSFHGVELGLWLLDRFSRNERSARAALRAIGHYCGW